MPINEYEEKQDARRERYLERAEKARNSAETLQTTGAIAQARQIPFGQPILIGHHSEKRDRNLLTRADNAMRKSVELGKKADYYDDKAASVGKGGISSDDPEAVTKLREKIEKAEGFQALMKAANKIVKSKKLDNEEKIRQLSPMVGEKAAPLLLEPDFAGRLGFPSYELTNNNANIRRMKQRIEHMRAEQENPGREPIQGDGFRIYENKEINRLCFEFDQKPSREVCQIMKSHGFRWNRTQVAWTRHLHNGSRHAADMAKAEIERAQQ